MRPLLALHPIGMRKPASLIQLVAGDAGVPFLGNSRRACDSARLGGLLHDQRVDVVIELAEVARVHVGVEGQRADTEGALVGTRGEQDTNPEIGVYALEGALDPSLQQLLGQIVLPRRDFSGVDADGDHDVMCWDVLAVGVHREGKDPCGRGLAGIDRKSFQGPGNDLACFTLEGIDHGPLRGDAGYINDDHHTPRIAGCQGTRGVAHGRVP